MALHVALLLLVAVASTSAKSHFKERCEVELVEGLKVLEEAYGALAAEAEHDRASRLRKARSIYSTMPTEVFGMEKEEKEIWEGQRAERKTVEEVAAAGDTTTTEEPTTPPTTPDPCPGATQNNRNCTAPSGMREKRSTYSYKFPRLMTDQGIDPLAHYAEMLHSALSNVSSCDPKFTDLNGVTEAQLYGMLSTLATRTPGPFCSLCHRLTEEMHTRIIKPMELLSGKSHAVISKLLTHLPSPKTLCSAIAPACHKDYEQKVKKTSEATICLECSLCNIALNVVQHRVLLDKTFIRKVRDHLRRHLFRAACEDICCIPPEQLPPPLHMDFQTCMDTTLNYFDRIIDGVTQLLRPERMCTLELGWCELNEAPNALHCLRELCVENLSDNPALSFVCDQIPDRPAEADKFLNVHETKVYKSRQKRHADFEDRMQAQIDAMGKKIADEL